MNPKETRRWSGVRKAVTALFVVAATSAIIVPAWVSARDSPGSTPGRSTDPAVAATPNGSADTPDVARAKVVAQDAVRRVKLAPGEGDPANRCLLVENLELSATVSGCATPAEIEELGALILGQPYGEEMEIIGFVGSGYTEASAGQSRSDVVDGVFTLRVAAGSESHSVVVSGPAGERTIKA